MVKIVKKPAPRIKKVSVRLRLKDYQKLKRIAKSLAVSPTRMATLFLEDDILGTPE